MNPKDRLAELGRIRGAASPVVSVYLDTRWSDEHQRDRVRVFVKNEVRRARAAADSPDLLSDLDWVEAQTGALVNQAAFPEANGTALFACRALGLREVLPIRVPFEDTFVVSERPYLRPLVDALTESPEAVVVFVDGEVARLVPVDAGGVGEEVRLEQALPGRHRRGGWALLAQSRYQRHLAEQRDNHLKATAQALLQVVEQGGARRIVLAGEPRTVAALREHLPRAFGDRVVGTVSGVRQEPAAVLVGRATGLLGVVEREEEAAAVDGVLTEAAKGGRAVAGLEMTLTAVQRGAVRRLYLLKTFHHSGMACRRCGSLQAGGAPTCALCGEPSTPVELGEALTDRVVETGGTVETLAGHQALAERGGVAAQLRYPL